MCNIKSVKRNNWIIFWLAFLPFRSSSLCDSNARSISVLFGASFGELRSSCPSIAHDLRLHQCIPALFVIHPRSRTRQVLSILCRTSPKNAKRSARVLRRSLLLCFTVLKPVQEDYAAPFPGRQADRLTSPT